MLKSFRQVTVSGWPDLKSNHLETAHNNLTSSVCPFEQESAEALLGVQFPQQAAPVPPARAGGSSDDEDGAPLSFMRRPARASSPIDGPPYSDSDSDASQPEECDREWSPELPEPRLREIRCTRVQNTAAVGGVPTNATEPAASGGGERWTLDRLRRRAAVMNGGGAAGSVPALAIGGGGGAPRGGGAAVLANVQGAGALGAVSTAGDEVVPGGVLRGGPLIPRRRMGALGRALGNADQIALDEQYARALARFDLRPTRHTAAAKPELEKEDWKPSVPRPSRGILSTLESRRGPPFTPRITALEPPIQFDCFPWLS